MPDLMLCEKVILKTFFFLLNILDFSFLRSGIIYTIDETRRLRKEISQVRPCLINFWTWFSRKRGVENSEKYLLYILDSPFMRDKGATLIPFPVHVIRPLILSQRQSFFCFAKFTRIYSRQLAV